VRIRSTAIETGIGLIPAPIMHSLFLPEAWLFDPPKILVLGEGPYSHALSQVLKAAHLGFDAVGVSGLLPDSSPTPLVWNDLRLVFLICDSSHSAGDLLASFRRLWDQVQILTTEQEEHRLAVVFILPRRDDAMEPSLARGLGLSEIDPARSGIGIARMGDSLVDILDLASRVKPTDFVTVRNRLASDDRRKALRQLGALMSDEANVGISRESMRHAAAEVTEQFRGCEYDLDLFCRPPRHPNGNTLRQWLNRAVTGVVTPLEWKEIVAELD